MTNTGINLAASETVSAQNPLSADAASTVISGRVKEGKVKLVPAHYDILNGSVTL